MAILCWRGGGILPRTPLNKRNSFFVIDGIIIHNQTDIANHFHISRQAINSHMKSYNHNLEQTFQWYKEKQNAQTL